MITCIIIDDNAKATHVIVNLLHTFCPEIEVLQTCYCIKDAVSAINKHKPSVVFLDIELNGETGFDLFKYFPTPQFKTIFTTAHEKFAIKAIKASCLDFILKPIEPEDLVGAVQKVKHSALNGIDIPVLLNNIDSNSKIVNRIVVSTLTNYNFIDTKDIICLHGEGKYTTFYTTQNEPLIASKNIGEYEDILEGNTFFRCHKAWIINMQHTKKLNKNDNTILLTNMLKASVSVRKKEELLKLVANFS